MSFSDEDLKTLKEASTRMPFLKLRFDNVQALIARLEAGEAVIAICEAIPNEMPVVINMRVAEWLLSKGERRSSGG